MFCLHKFHHFLGLLPHTSLLPSPTGRCPDSLPSLVGWWTLLTLGWWYDVCPCFFNMLWSEFFFIHIEYDTSLQESDFKIKGEKQIFGCVNWLIMWTVLACCWISWPAHPKTFMAILHKMDVLKRWRQLEEKSLQWRPDLGEKWSSGPYNRRWKTEERGETKPWCFSTCFAVQDVIDDRREPQWRLGSCILSQVTNEIQGFCG